MTGVIFARLTLARSSAHFIREQRTQPRDSLLQRRTIFGGAIIRIFCSCTSTLGRKVRFRAMYCIATRPATARGTAGRAGVILRVFSFVSHVPSFT